MNCQNLFFLANRLNKHCSKLKSTSSHSHVEAKGLIVINTQSKNLFLVIGVGFAGKNDGSKPIDKEVPPTPTDGDIADKKPSITGGKDITNKKLPAITERDVVDKRSSVIRGGDNTDKKAPRITNGDIKDKRL